MDTMASQITSLTIVCATVYSRRRSKKTSKLCVTGLCAGNSPVIGEFPAQRTSNAENVSIWWRHHEWWSCPPLTYIYVTRPPWVFIRHYISKGIHTLLSFMSQRDKLCRQICQTKLNRETLSSEIDPYMVNSNNECRQLLCNRSQRSRQRRDIKDPLG